MSNRFNPFKPGDPVYSGMFTGRLDEILGIEKSLFQTKNGNHQNIIFVGERGIGKSSLLLYARYLASKEYNFLSIFISLSDNTDLKSLACKIQDGLERQLATSNQALNYLKKLWKFVKTIEIPGTLGIKTSQDARTDDQIIDDIVYSLASTVKSLTADSQLKDLGLSKKKDGLIIFIDEADKASDNLKLGTFLKYLNEILISEGAINFLIIMAGLPNIREVLRKSHESSLRLFKEYELKPLSEAEVKNVIRYGIQESNQMEKNLPPFTINEEALDLIFSYSEGYPHFVQQIGASTFEENNDNIISENDVRAGFFSDGGALQLIGDRYYRHYYGICSKEEKTILKIIASKWNNWNTIEEIKKQYKGKASTLHSCLRTLKEKGVILKKEGTRGEYRLQWSSFAFWISFQKL